MHCLHVMSHNVPRHIGKSIVFWYANRDGFLAWLRLDSEVFQQKPVCLAFRSNVFDKHCHLKHLAQKLKGRDLKPNNDGVW